MGLRKYIRLLAVPLVALLLLSFGTVAAGAPDKSPRGEEPGDGAVTVLSNGIYKVSILNDMSGDPGIFTVGTGSEHPVPEADMLYGGWEEYPATSYLSVWDYGSGVVYTSDSEFSSVEPAGSYAIAYMGAWGVEFESSRRQATTRWFPEGHIEVEQEVEVIGSSLSNSAVRVTTKVSNTSDHRREVGIRYFWDIMVADEDGVWYATRDPGSSFGQSERIYTRPTFDRFVATDYPDGPELLVFGSMKGPKGVFSPNPTPPARFIFGSYSNHSPPAGVIWVSWTTGSW